VLFANKLPFFRRFDTAPIVHRFFSKTLIYCAAVFLIRFLERLVKYWVAGGTLSGNSGILHDSFFVESIYRHSDLVFVLFLIYTAGSELNSLFGNGELIKILFSRRSSELKLNRRQRVRTLVKLSRLTETHTLDELRDRNTAAHLEMIDMITN